MGYDRNNSGEHRRCGFRLLIERKHGIWEIELQSAGVPNLERGIGADFNEAWGNITETIPERRGHSTGA